MRGGKVNKVRTESYLYLEPREHRGHVIGHRTVHVLPKGTLHDENGTAKARQAAQERSEALYSSRGVIQAPQKQLSLGTHSPGVFGEAGEPGRERTLGTAQGVARGKRTPYGRSRA